MENNIANSRKNVNNKTLQKIWNHKFERKKVTPNEQKYKGNFNNSNI
jgi:hypothetical protein